MFRCGFLFSRVLCELFKGAVSGLVHKFQCWFTQEQQTPLHIASRLGNVDNVVLLLQHGANVDATTKDKYTPLHIAAKEGHDEVAQVLLENEASHNVTTKVG